MTRRALALGGLALAIAVAGCGPDAPVPPSRALGRTAGDPASAAFSAIGRRLASALRRRHAGELAAIAVDVGTLRADEQARLDAVVLASLEQALAVVLSESTLGALVWTAGRPLPPEGSYALERGAPGVEMLVTALGSHLIRAFPDGTRPEQRAIDREGPVFAVWAGADDVAAHALQRLLRDAGKGVGTRSAAALFIGSLRGPMAPEVACAVLRVAGGTLDDPTEVGGFAMDTVLWSDALEADSLLPFLTSSDARIRLAVLMRARAEQRRGVLGHASVLAVRSVASDPVHRVACAAIGILSRGGVAEIRDVERLSTIVTTGARDDVLAAISVIERMEGWRDERVRILRTAAGSDDPFVSNLASEVILRMK